MTDVDGDGATDIVGATSGGVEVQRNICLNPRIRVAAVPRRVAPGNPVQLVMHGLSATAFGGGSMTIRQDGVLVAQDYPRPGAYSVLTWTSAPLAEGRHVFTIEYTEQYAGTSTTTLTVDARDSPPRRRSARH